MAEVTKEAWQQAVHQVEAELIARGYSCDDLVPQGTTSDGSSKQCIACLVSIGLRERLLGDEA